MGHYCVFSFFYMGGVTGAETGRAGGIAETEVKAEEEPKGETIVGSGRKALRPPDMNIISFSNKFSLFSGGFGKNPWYSFILGSLWSLGEPEEDEGEG